MPPTLVRLWTALAGLACGTVAGLNEWALPLPVRIVAGMVCMLLVPRRTPLVLLGLFVSSFALGELGSQPRASPAPALETLARSVPRCTFTGRVLEQVGGLGTLAAARRVSCDGTTVVDGGMVIVERTEAPPGAGVTGEAWLVPLSSDGFGRARAQLGAAAVVSGDALEVGPVAGWHHALAARVRAGLRRAAERLGHPSGAIVLGMTVGDTSTFDATTIRRFRRSGLAHLLAVSGSNVAIVVGFVALCARRLWLVWRTLLALLGVVMFVVLVGPDASVLRAAAMAVLSLVALWRGRSVEPLHGLALALIALVALRPALVFSVGLYLSAAATAGIIVWAPIFVRRLRRVPEVLRLPLAVTLSAQAGVLPLLLAFFGEVSLVAPVANLLALPAVPVVTILGLAAGAATLVDDDLALVAARVAQPFAAWIGQVAERLGEPGWAALAAPRWAGPVAGVVVCAVALGTLRRAERADATDAGVSHAARA